MPPAARVGDDHKCPMFSGTVAHVGGPVMLLTTSPPNPPLTLPNVLIGGQPAAAVNYQCTCVGPPDSITKGSSSVLINGQAAARQGDMTKHGGMITAGCATVMIGG